VTRNGSSAPQRPITKLEKTEKKEDKPTTKPGKVDGGKAPVSEKDITSFTTKTGGIHKDVLGSNLSDWRYIFGAKSPNTTGSAIRHFKSRDELIKFSDAQFALKPRPKSAEVSKLIADRVEEKMDFSKNDLVVVLLHTGGPPFGKFRQELKDGTLRFWIEEPQGVRMRGAALRTIFKFYRIPKGLKVVER